MTVDGAGAPGGDGPVLYPTGSDHRRVAGRAARRVTQVPALARRAVQHPGWILEAVRMASRRRRSSAMAFDPRDHPGLLADEAEALAAVTGIPIERCAEALAATRSPLADETLGGHPLYGARTTLLRLVGAVVGLTEPAVVVETGVAQGLTSAAILEALEANGRGRLHSIDLPVLGADDGEFVGRLVPARLRHRWTLHRGPSAQLLAPLLADLGHIDVFLHDAEHTYDAQLAELRTVWPRLRPGAVVLVDDVNNPAFVDFARSVDGAARLVVDGAGRDAVGVLGRP